MSLTSGTRLAPYEIVAPLGAGGMGEVYRATDTHPRARSDSGPAARILFFGPAEASEFVINNSFFTATRGRKHTTWLDA